MFGFLGGFKFLKYALVVGFFGVLIFMGWQYHSSTQGRITSLMATNSQLVSANAQHEANAEILKGAVEQANQTVANMEAAYERVRADYEEVSAEFQIIRMRNDELANRLGRHELDVLAARKPGLVETRINNATDLAFRCLELETGAPLNDKERNATTAREANSECPWVFEDLP